MENGTSNSWATFMASQDSDKKWEDPEFKTDQSSLRYEKNNYFPEDLAWIRPPDMGHYDDRYTREPKLWGNLGKPIPNGV